jgi:enoyl-CoA hydratase
MELSLTGRVLDAQQALALGLVNDVVAHDELLACAKRIAQEIAATDPTARRTILRLYRRNAMTTPGDAWDNETEDFVAFRESFDPSRVRDPRAR